MPVRVVGCKVIFLLKFFGAEPHLHLNLTNHTHVTLDPFWGGALGSQVWVSGSGLVFPGFFGIYDFATS